MIQIQSRQRSRMVVTSGDDDVQPIVAFLDDSHANGVASCMRNIESYGLDDAQMSIFVAAYERYQNYETDHWIRMLDFLHRTHIIDCRIFQVFNDRLAGSASFDERRLVERRSKQRDQPPNVSPANDERLPGQLHGQFPGQLTGQLVEQLSEQLPEKLTSQQYSAIIEDLGNRYGTETSESTGISLQLRSAIQDIHERNERLDHAIVTITATIERLLEYVHEFDLVATERIEPSFHALDLDIGDLRSAIESINTQLHSARGVLASKPVELFYRTVDEHQQIQFFGRNTYTAKEFLNQIGATWIASNQMWVVSKEKGETFMTEHAIRFVFSQVGSK
jgi:hypothetical protein